MSDEVRGRTLGRRARPAPVTSVPPEPVEGGEEPVVFTTSVGAFEPRPAPLLPEGAGVPEAVRRRRTIGGMLGASGALLALALAVTWALLREPAPPRAPEEVVEAAPQRATVATLSLGQPIAIRRPSVRGPADATIQLPAEHRFQGAWRLRCPEWVALLGPDEGRLTQGQTLVTIPEVPPSACTVSFPHSGWQEVPVTAGARVVCRKASSRDDSVYIHCR